MKNLWLYISLISIFLLAACGSQQAAIQEPMPGVENPGKVLPTPSPRPTIPLTDQINGVEPSKCTVKRTSITPESTEVSLFAPVSEADWVLGPENAALTIVEYSDLQCSYCANLEPIVVQLYENYPDDVRLVFRHFPLSAHDKSLLGAQALEAAGKQDSRYFFELKNFTFAAQKDWLDLSNTEFEAWLVEKASQIGMDPVQFQIDLKDPEIVQKVRQASAEAEQIGIPGTPFVLLNGEPYQGPRDYHSLESILKMYQLERIQFTECPDFTIDTAKQYIAILHTEIGDATIELYPDKAPTTVNNFIFLARHGWYDNIIFHRAISGFIVQAGDPSGTGYGGPGYAFGDEISSDLQFSQAGMVAMANSGPDSNGSQFFITLNPEENLNGRYPIFGKVIQGLEILSRVTPRDPTQAGTLPTGTLIYSIEIEEK